MECVFYLESAKKCPILSHKKRDGHNGKINSKQNWK